MTATPAPTASKVSYQIMPSMTDEQYAELKEDIRRNGVLVPIEYDQHGNIIDGHHRMRAVAELHAGGHDVDVPPAITRTYQDEESKLRFIVSFNERRRHLTAKQRQELVFTLRKRGMTLKSIGDMLQVSSTTIYWDIEGLTNAEKDELKQVVTQTSDGRAFPQKYAPRVTFSTGQAQLRDIQQQAINRAAGDIKKLGYTVAAAVGNEGTVVSEGENTEYVPVDDSSNFQRLLVRAQAATVISDEDARKRISAFSWYGGKSSQLKWLLPLLPPTKHFVDVFGGSAAVLMNRDPSPIETYNDLDSNVTNFFRQVRDHTEDLVRLVALTPYSREERRLAYDQLKQEFSGTDLERARLFFVMARQTRSGLAQSRNNHLNSWHFTRDAVVRGMAKFNHEWESAIDGISAVASRFRRVQVENYDWSRVIALYDTQETLFYCDPPYVHDTRTASHNAEYAFEMTDDDHTKLATALHSIKGLAAISGYPSELYNKLYSDWYRVDMFVSSAAARGSVASERTECLWTNYKTLPQPQEGD